MTGRAPRFGWPAFGRRGRPDEATCAEAMRRLQAWLDDAVTEPELIRVRRHLQMCRRCGLEAQTYRAIGTSLRACGTRIDAAARQRLQAYVVDLTGGLGPLR